MHVKNLFLLMCLGISLSAQAEGDSYEKATQIARTTGHTGQFIAGAAYGVLGGAAAAFTLWQAQDIGVAMKNLIGNPGINPLGKLLKAHAQFIGHATITAILFASSYVMVEDAKKGLKFFHPKG